MSAPSELRQQIENLATCVIVADWSAGDNFELSLQALKDAVRGVQERAEQGGCPRVARVAADLAVALASPAGAAPDLARVLEAGVAELQHAMEDGCPPPAPAAFSLAQDPELLSDFVLESREHLSAIETRSLALEQDPG